MANRVAVQEVGSLKELVVDLYEQEFQDDQATPRVNEVDMSPNDKRFIEIIHKGMAHNGVRFVVPLPFKNTEPHLPNNKQQAVNRALGQAKRCRKMPITTKSIQTL